MSWSGEGGQVASGQEDLRCGLDSDSWHRRQDRGKREVVDQLLYLFGDDVPLAFELFDLSCDSGDDELNSVSTGHCDGLLG